MSKEWLEDIKERFVKYEYDYNLNGEDVEWLIQQAEHRQKLLERLRKHGIEIKKLKNQLFRCREKNKKLDWNLLVLKGTAEQAMRANRSNYELVNKLEEENKRLREALEFYAGGNHYSDKLYDDKIILLDDGEIARKALEEKMI